MIGIFIFNQRAWQRGKAVIGAETRHSLLQEREDISHFCGSVFTCI